KRGERDSFGTNNQSVEVNGKSVKLPKMGWIKMFEDLRFEGEISKVTISRTAHRWFISITVETENTIAVDKTSTHPVIGIDVGINTLATCSDGSKYENPRPLKRYEKKLARFQRRLSKRVRGSNNWYKQKDKVARLHYRIACMREDAHQKATTDIVNRVSGIGIETLKVSNMLRNRKIAKALSDSALGGFLSIFKN
ncbi:transposase, partial [Candidatus Poribacteria bacterium]|nr:transposase [Candidatus Poribacteria bacterium]